MGGTGIGSLGILFLVFCGLSVILCSCSPTSCYYAGKLGEGVEEVNFYKPGGFHPVLLGDVLDGRFKVVNKLGYASWQQCGSAGIWIR